MWETVKDWFSERNWWRIAFWALGIVESYQVAIDEGIFCGVLQIFFWWVFLQVSQNIMLKDMDNGADKPKWY
jgi:hypothetical protein